MICSCNYLIKCTKCGFESGTLRLCGFSLYRLPLCPELDVSWESGWCNNCKNFTRVEIMPDKNMILKQLQELNEEKRKKLKSFEISTFRSDYKKSKLYRNIEDFAEKLLWLRLLELRKDPAKCLSCGSTDFIPVKLTYPEREEAINLDFRHPVCGGVLTIQFDFRAYMSFKPKYYDVNGNLIES